MTCVLRVSGTTLDVDQLLQSLPIKPFRSWRKGDKYTERSPNSKLHADSGATFDVSKADMGDFVTQQEDALAFLTAHGQALESIVAYPGTEYVQLDFGIESGSAWIQSYVLSPGFLRAAANAGVSVELSYYKQSEET